MKQDWGYLDHRRLADNNNSRDIHLYKKWLTWLGTRLIRFQPLLHIYTWECILTHENNQQTISSKEEDMDMQKPLKAVE